MFGCGLKFFADASPQVVPADSIGWTCRPRPLSPARLFGKYEALVDALRSRFGYVIGDVGWGGVLNTALDLRGQQFLMDLIDLPDEAAVLSASWRP